MLSSAELLVTAPTEQDLQVELVRMCIDEGGYDPALIEPYDGPSPDFTFVCINDAIPIDVCWRARELVGIGDPKCLRCTMRDRRDRGAVRPCRATARLELDCGAPRPDTGETEPPGDLAETGQPDVAGDIPWGPHRVGKGTRMGARSHSHHSAASTS